jgi:hypothetical protein
MRERRKVEARAVNKIFVVPFHHIYRRFQLNFTTVGKQRNERQSEKHEMFQTVSMWFENYVSFFKRLLEVFFCIFLIR